MLSVEQVLSRSAKELQETEGNESFGTEQITFASPEHKKKRLDQMPSRPATGKLKKSEKCMIISS